MLLLVGAPVHCFARGLIVLLRRPSKHPPKLKGHRSLPGYTLSSSVSLNCGNLVFDVNKYTSHGVEFFKLVNLVIFTSIISILRK